MIYSQNNEQEIILEYFSNTTGRLLDIGANDGVTFSNSLALLERGWSGILVEPSTSCVDKLKLLHEGNTKVTIEAIAIGNQTAIMEFHESGSLLNKGDNSLVSTLKIEEKDRWSSLDMTWNIGKVPVYDFKDFKSAHPHSFDFITIDAEGMDYDILKQINLTNVGCKLICVEWNGKDFDLFNDYITKFGHKLIHKNAENLIYGL